ncbi:Aste57867_5039 [Aphanomyces stellatus]|uniref:Aste57867_5039 protein n=1 Tax=Aphanomyces stellatus TaxID=120398 RepID=A0A485KE16_9STRA|nr:hypothetical protein As57867_005026 [Aphanomyces stellatus]VFT82120.1 Aste57867_5039 [Aphanomyces stellatus]
MDLDDSYDGSVDEVDEDAELELSCALQVLTSRCKTFSAKMTDEIPEIDDGGEISEDDDLPQDDDDEGDANGTRHPATRRRAEAKDDDDDDADASFVHQTQEELSSIQSNIKHLLAKLEHEAKKRTNVDATASPRRRREDDDDDDDDADDGKRGDDDDDTNQRQEK